jgi:phospholipase C
VSLGFLIAVLIWIISDWIFSLLQFAEHPGPTNVNRQFATSGSSCGMVDNIHQSAGFFANVTGTNCTKSIFQVLDEANISWKNVGINQFRPAGVYALIYGYIVL